MTAYVSTPRLLSGSMIIALAGACIPAAGFELTGGSSDDPFETDGPYDPTVNGDAPTSVGGETAGDSAEAGSTTGGDDDDDEPSGSGGHADVSTGGVFGSTSGQDGETTSGGDDDSSGSTGAADAAFGPPAPFGDDLDESALVGTWTVAWNRDGTPHWSLEIADDGSFTWFEAAASCSTSATASGVLWVDDERLVLHVESWDKRDPWPVESVVGQSLRLPFRLHLDYAMAGGMLSVSGPWELTALLGWEGRVYRREPASGPAGTWTAGAALEAVLPGEDAPRTIVQDVYTMETLGGAVARATTQRTWTHGDSPVSQPEVTETASWYNLTPGQPQGMISIGGITHLYDAERLVAFDETRIFSKEAPQGCD